MAQLISGKALAAEVKQRVAQGVAAFAAFFAKPIDIFPPLVV